MVGPTAVGKSEIALEVARRTGASILSVDSMQVYRGMDIGTAKPSETERAEIRHLMIDVADPEDDYSVAEFQRTARVGLEGTDGPVVLVGGSGLHFRAVVDPLEFPPSDPDVRMQVEGLSDEELLTELRAADPEVDDVVDTRNRRRVVRAVEILRLTGDAPSGRARSDPAQAVRAYRSLYPVTVFGLDRSDELEERVRLRVEDMRSRGLLAEVARLRDRLGLQAGQAVGYKELVPVVDGEVDESVGFGQVVRSTMGLVKRQRTFFRRDPRIRWHHPSEPGLAEAISEAVEGASVWTS